MNVSKALLADHRLELLQGSRGLFPSLVVAMSQAREEILF